MHWTLFLASCARRLALLLACVGPSLVTSQAGAQAINLALDGVASQSSLAFGGEADRAIDGDTDGTWSVGSVTHTDDLIDSWWQVDLGAPYALDTLRIYNRSDCCGGRLSNFRVSVEESAAEVYGEDFFLGTGSVPQGGMLEILLPPDTFGQVIWIGFYGLNNDGNGYLSLAEVEVLGDGSVGDQFMRGDANGDGGFDISDAIYGLAALFVPGTAPPSCVDAADADDNGVFDLLDPTFALESLFISGSLPPSAPTPPSCGLDPTPDPLACGVPSCP